jgi:protein TonB
MTGYGPAREDRIKGAAGSAVLVVLIGYGLIVGLGVDFPHSVVERLQVVALLPDSPPPRPIRCARRSRRRRVRKGPPRRPT